MILACESHYGFLEENIEEVEKREIVHGDWLTNATKTWMDTRSFDVCFVLFFLAIIPFKFMVDASEAGDQADTRVTELYVKMAMGMGIIMAFVPFGLLIPKKENEEVTVPLETKRRLPSSWKVANKRAALSY